MSNKPNRYQIYQHQQKSFHVEKNEKALGVPTKQAIHLDTL